MTTHIEPHLLKRLRRGVLGAAGRRRLEEHLSEGCPGCSVSVARILVEQEPGEPRPPIVRPGDLVRRHPEGRGLDAHLEELVAPGLAAVLEAFEEPEAFRLIAEDRAYRTMALASHLTEASNRWMIRDMVRAYHLARRAVAVAAHVSPSRHGHAKRFDLQGEAAMVLANASRCRSRFYEARQAMNMATSLLEQGSGDVRDRAQLASRKATLALDLGYFRDALHWLRESEAYGALLPGSVQPTITFIQRSIVVSYVDPVSGVRLAELAQRRVDREREPWLHCCARHTLAANLERNGRGTEALRLLDEPDRHEYQVMSEPHQLRSLMLRAKTLGQVRRFREAIGLLELLRDEFDRRELGCELADTLGYLGEIHLLQGREARARRAIEDAASMYSMLGAEYRASTLRGLLRHH